MTARSRSPAVPQEVIRLEHYAQLELYLTKFARGELGLVLLLGRHGTGKSESVKQALSASVMTSDSIESITRGALYVEGHMQPFGLYRQLWNYHNQPVVLDDLDRLYADADCVRLLKPLCNTVHEKQVHWLTNLTLSDGALPPTFTTTSNVILIANEWKSLNPNVRALEDRAIMLHFCPSNDEIHQKVGQWFDDSEVCNFLSRLLPVIPAIGDFHATLLQRISTAPGRPERLAKQPSAYGDPGLPNRMRHRGAARSQFELRAALHSAVYCNHRSIPCHIFSNQGKDDKIAIMRQLSDPPGWLL